MRSRCSIPVMRPSRANGPDRVLKSSLSGPFFGSYASLDLSLGLASLPAAAAAVGSGRGSRPEGGAGPAGRPLVDIEVADFPPSCRIPLLNA